MKKRPVNLRRQEWISAVLILAGIFLTPRVNQDWPSAKEKKVSDPPVRRGLLIFGGAAITGVVLITSIFTWELSPSWVIRPQVILVCGATIWLDIIFRKLIRPDSSPDLDSTHPELHFTLALLAFSIGVVSAAAYGFTYSQPASSNHSVALVTLVIEGTTVPAGAALVVAAQARTKTEPKS